MLRILQLNLGAILLLLALQGFAWPYDTELSLPGDGTRQVPVRFYDGLYLIGTPDATYIDQLFLSADSMMRKRQPTPALQYLKQADSIAHIQPAWKVPVYLKTALIYEQLNNYNKATAYNFMALESIANEGARKRWEAGCYINIGWLQRQAGNNVTAEVYVQKAIDLYRQIEVPNTEKINALLLQTHLAKVHHRYQEVNQLFLEACQLIQAEKSTTEDETKQAVLSNMEHRIYNNIADTYLYLHQPDSALSWLKKTETNMPLLPPYIQALIYLTKGQAYAQKNSFEPALKNFRTVMGLSLHYDYNNIQMVVNKELLELYTRKGDIKRSWQYQKQYIDLLEQGITTMEKNIHTINGQEANYYLAKKDKEIAHKELQIMVQQSKVKERNLWAIILIIVILSLLGFAFSLYKYFINKKKLADIQISNMEKSRKIMQIEAGIKGEEKERKRIAMELHDGIVGELMALKINLEAIPAESPGLQQCRKYQYALIQSEDIAKRLRETAHNLMPVHIRETGLIGALRTFLDTIDTVPIRFIFQYYGQLPELSGEVEKIIYLIVLELIQNILKHSNASEALIQLHYFEGTLNITVEDNGIGISKNAAAGGIGLSHIREQIALLNGRIDIQGSAYTGTTIFIELPLFPKEEPPIVNEESSIKNEELRIKN